MIRPCDDADRGAIETIINQAAEAYRGVIPADRWHEPYMGRDELDGEIRAGGDRKSCDKPECERGCLHGHSLRPEHFRATVALRRKKRAGRSSR